MLEESQEVRLTRLIEQLEENVRNLQAREAIRDVLGRYCRGIDRLDHAVLMSCYHDDAVDEHGYYTTRSAKEFADLAISGTEEVFSRSFFSVGTVLINLQGDVADVESYINSSMVLREPDEQGREHTRMGGVRCIDRFERRNGEWKIAHRKFVVDVSIFHPLPTQSYKSLQIGDPANVPPSGRRDKSDLSYEHNPVPDSVINGAGLTS